jgi:O-antigen/teichoic acid export membrane protein
MLKGVSPSIITTMALGLSSAINFLGVMIWVRILGPSEFGIYALLSATALFLNSIIFEWVRSISGRLLYNRGNRFLLDPAKSYILLIIIAFLVTALLMATGIIVLSNLSIGGVEPSVLPYIIVFTISEMALSIINSTSRVRELYWQYFSSMVTRSLLVLIAGFVFVHFFGGGAKGLVIGTCVGQLITVVLIVIRDPIWRALKVSGALLAFKGNHFSEVLRYGAPMVLSNGLTYFISVADRYIIAAFSGSLLVGLYVAPLDLTNKTIGVLMLALNISFYPSIVRAFEDHGSDSAVGKLKEGFASQILLLSLPLIIMISFPKQTCLVLLGSKFSAIPGIVLPALAISVAARLLISNYLMLVFQLKRKMSGVVIIPLISLTIFVPLASVGILHYGISGVAVAAAAAQILTFSIGFLLAKRLMPIEVLTSDVRRLLLINAVIICGCALLPKPVTTVAFLLSCIAVSVAFVASVIICKVSVTAPISGYVTSRIRRHKVG